ncbi:unnamed protein product [Ixodes pacificus]
MLMGTTRRERGDLQLFQGSSKTLQAFAATGQPVPLCSEQHCVPCRGFVQALRATTLATNRFVDAQKYSRCSTSAAHRYCFSRYHGMKEVALPSSCDILQALGYSYS